MVISKDERGLPSKEGLNIDDSIDDLVENIINSIDYKKKNALSKEEDGFKRVPGKYDLKELTLRRLKQTNHFRHITVNPVICLEIYYQFPKKQRDTDSHFYHDPNSQEKEKIHKYFQSFVENDVMGRLFKFLGIQNPFKVTSHYTYGYFEEDKVEFKVEITI